MSILHKKDHGMMHIIHVVSN